MNQTFGVLELLAIKALLALALAVVTWVGVRLERLIQTRVKNERVQGLLLRLDNAAVNAVKEVEQAFISNLKSATLADFVKAREMAIETIKTHFGTQGLADLQKDLCLDSAEAVEKLIASVLEARVHDIKSQNSVPAGALTGQAVTPAMNPEKGV